MIFVLVSCHLGHEERKSALDSEYCVISLIKRGRISWKSFSCLFLPLSTDVDRSGCYSLLSKSSGSMCFLPLQYKLNLQRRNSSHFPRSNMFALLKRWTKNYMHCLFLGINISNWTRIFISFNNTFRLTSQSEE